MERVVHLGTLKANIDVDTERSDFRSVLVDLSVFLKEAPHTI